MTAGGTSRRGFTLVELMVVIGVIMLVAGMALPSIVRLFNAGADAQTYNVLNSQLSAARALAIQESTFSAVHMQMVDNAHLVGTPPGNPEAPHPELAAACYSAVFLRKKIGGQKRFTGVTGYPAIRMPGTMAFGEISDTFVEGSEYKADAFPDVAVGVPDPDFTSLTIVFSSLGALTTQVEGENVRFDPAAIPFLPGEMGLWNHPVADNEPGVRAVTMFDYIQYKVSPPTQRPSFLNQNGQILPINVYTGQLFVRK